jgi:hypothetical protein
MQESLTHDHHRRDDVTDVNLVQRTQWVIQRSEQVARSAHDLLRRTWALLDGPSRIQGVRQSQDLSPID